MYEAVYFWIDSDVWMFALLSLWLGLLDRLDQQLQTNVRIVSWAFHLKGDG
jgi:hypothetical protein